MQSKDALIFATKKLQEKNIELPNLEARILLSYATNKSQEYLLTADKKLSILEQDTFITSLNRRLNLEPIAYILGYKEFYGRNFKVTNKVLIPRPDTEILVDAVLDTFKQKHIKILELGVGSGCVIVTLLLENLEALATATDISNDALLIAQENSGIHNVQSRLNLVSSNWFDELSSRKFDVIISNPPYIPLKDKPLMSLETIKFEPELALFSSSSDGLNSYKIISENAKKFLKPNGKLFLEVGFNQAKPVTKIFLEKNYTFDKCYKDLSNYIRVVQFSVK